MRRLLLAFLVLAPFLLVALVSSPDAPARLKLKRIGSFDQPVFATSPPGDRRRLFVVEQGGYIRVLVDGRRRRAPFLAIPRQTTGQGEQGLLGLAFAPDYARSRRFYVNYTDNQGDTRVVEYRRSARNPDRADPRTRRDVISHPGFETNHNGGNLVFGPDGLLYIGTGDGGGGGDRHGRRGHAQDLGSVLGKILRVDPRRDGRRPYRVPRDNPFVDRRGARPEVWAWGLRNPWRFSFDRQTGDLTVGDVGQNAYEEISFLPFRRARGANFGWRVWEGRHRFAPGESAPGHVPPVIEYGRSGGCSVVGGHVIRDPALGRMRGRYLYGDFCDGTIRSALLSARGARSLRSEGVEVPSLSSFGEDARGRIVATSLEGGVFRLVLP